MGTKEKLKKGPVVLYEQMRLKILELIEERDLQPHDPVPSEGDLAHIFGVSTRTSKEALITLAKEGIVYRLPRRGTFLAERPESSKRSKQKFLAIVLPEIDDYIGQVISSVARQALERDFELVVRLSDGSLAKEEAILRELAAGSLVSGIILFPGDRRTCGDEVLRLHLAKFPIVIVDRIFREINIPSVYHDHYQGAYDVTQYLVHKGHAHIGFVSEDMSGVMSREERYYGYIQALLDHNTPVHTNLIQTRIQDHTKKQSNGEREEQLRSIEELQHFLKGNPDMTAVFCSNDYVAMDVMYAAERLGLRIPDDISIAGFTDFPIARLLSVALTSVRKPAAILGETAVNLLLERISTPDAVPDSIKLKTVLVERQSVRALTEMRYK